MNCVFKLLPSVLLALLVFCQKQPQKQVQTTTAVKDTVVTTEKTTQTVDTFPKALQIMHDAFVKNNTAHTTLLQRILSTTDTASYNDFLKNSKTGIDTIDTAAVSSLLAAYKEAGNNYLHVEAVLEQIQQKMVDSTGNTEQRLHDLQILTSSVDKNGIFRSGLLVDTNLKGDPDLRSTRVVDGSVLLLNPQIVYRWPGNSKSAQYIIQPTGGPYRVKAAVTFYPKVTTHCQEWKNGRVQASKYLDLTNKTDLLIEDANGNDGWISMDSVAFFDTSFNRSLNDGMSEFYRMGYAWYLHGVWLGEDKHEPNDPGDTSPPLFLSKGDITRMNLLRMEWSDGDAIDRRNLPRMCDNYYSSYELDPKVSEDDQGMGAIKILALNIFITRDEDYVLITFISRNSNSTSMDIPFNVRNDTSVSFGGGLKYTMKEFFKGN